MSELLDHQDQLEAVLKTLSVPVGISLRCWQEEDLSTIQQLSDQHGWPTNHTPAQVLASWRNAWPALVAVEDQRVIGYVRGLTDQHVVMHITDLLVDPGHRTLGIGRLLLQACHLLYPDAGINLVAEPEAIPFYEAVGYRYGGKAYIYYKHFAANSGERPSTSERD
jgi:ribosomal protein S18 acetylase RimI-like enzyme